MESTYDFCNKSLHKSLYDSSQYSSHDSSTASSQNASPVDLCYNSSHNSSHDSSHDSSPSHDSSHELLYDSSHELMCASLLCESLHEPKNEQVEDSLQKAINLSASKTNNIQIVKTVMIGCGILYIASKLVHISVKLNTIIRQIDGLVLSMYILRADI